MNIQNKKITQKEKNSFLNSRYEVKTIIGIIEDSSVNTYILTKEGLDEFLEGYNEYDEFIISVKKIR